MSTKIILAFCAQAILAQLAYSACIGAGLAAPCGLAGNGLGYAGLAGNGLGYAGYGGNGFGYAGLAGAGCGGVASTGGGLPVTSASPVAPVGVSVLSENAYEGSLNVGGNLPFLGTVGLEGVLPTGGAGAASYGCGNGAVGIDSEGPIGTGITTPQNYAPNIGALGAGIGAYGPAGIAGIGAYGSGFAGYGAGFNGIGAGFAGVNGLGGCGCGAIY